MAADSQVLQGQVFRCPFCGSEVVVVLAGSARPTPHCCNRPMVLQDALAVVLYCPVCGAEVTVIRQGGCVPTPRCCNTPMLRRQPMAA
jgi:competence CoiA-like predicted nuclease